MPMTSGGDIVGGGDLESSVDTGTDFGQTAGGGSWGQEVAGGVADGHRTTGVTETADEMENIVEHLGGRNLTEEEQRTIDQTLEYAQNEREAAAERAAEQAAKEAEMAEAHANGDPYMWETTTLDGETVEVWILADGSTVYYDRDTETVVSMEWPPGEGPVYQGNMLYEGEAVTVYELPDGTTVLVDEDGTTVGYGDDIVSDTFYDPAWGQVYAVPQGPPSYDTLLYDAETGEVLVKVNTGKETVVIEDVATAEVEVYSRYYPPGADYYLLIDETGAVVDQIEIPPDEVLDVMGVLTVYDDGNVVVDVGVATLQVDIIGPEGGISFEVDVAEDLFEDADWLGSVEAGMEWDEDGFEMWAEADILEFGHVGAGMEVGKDGFEAWVEVESELEGIGFNVEGTDGHDRRRSVLRRW